MKCPHCLENFHEDSTTRLLGNDVDGYWTLTQRKCPACDKLIMHLALSKAWDGSKSTAIDLKSHKLILPRGSSRPPCPTEVTSNVEEDYNEACLVLPDSPKASAALSRRCLQSILREKAGVKAGNLANEIQEVIDSEKLPTELAESIDAIRHIGNFSAHPIKSTNTGEIVPVEDHEAEWNLEVIESCFDFYYVQPAKLKAKRAALDAKLGDAGKPPMK